jgi:hypothetical protein
MQFDHIGDEKIGDISSLIWRSSRKAVLDEIEKCQLLCANCHSLVSWKRQEEKILEKIA